MEDEILAVVDPWDNITGQAPRSKVHREGLWHRGVHVLLSNGEGELLVQQRARGRSQYAGLVDCTVSEHVRVGENYQEAAQRGLREELHLSAPTLDRWVKFRMVYGPMDNMVVEVYQGRHDGLPTRVDTQEVAQVGFASVRELMDHENSVTPWLREILKWRTGRQNLLTVL